MYKKIVRESSCKSTHLVSQITHQITVGCRAENWTMWITKVMI